MNIGAVIRNLKLASRGSRELDVQIAEILGWRKRVETFYDDAGDRRERTLYLVPKTEDPARVPQYSSNVQAAMELALQLDPAHVGGCSWEEGRGSAQILGYPPVQAATPALALCISALLLHPTAEQYLQSLQRS